jgi:hypothetical protein
MSIVPLAVQPRRPPVRVTVSVAPESTVAGTVLRLAPKQEPPARVLVTIAVAATGFVQLIVTVLPSGPAVITMFEPLGATESPLPSLQLPVVPPLQLRAALLEPPVYDHEFAPYFISGLLAPLKSPGRPQLNVSAEAAAGASSKAAPTTSPISRMRPTALERTQVRHRMRQPKGRQPAGASAFSFSASAR